MSKAKRGPDPLSDTCHTTGFNVSIAQCVVPDRSLARAILVSLKTLSGSEVKVSFMRSSRRSQNTLRQ